MVSFSPYCDRSDEIAPIARDLPRKRSDFPKITGNVYFCSEIFAPCPTASKRGRIPTPVDVSSDHLPSHLSFRASIFSALPLRHRLGLPFSFFVTRLGCQELFEWAIVSRRSDCSNGTSLPPKKKRQGRGGREREKERGRGVGKRQIDGLLCC